MWTIFKVFIECVTILLPFHALAFWLQGLRDPSFPSQGSKLHHLHCKAKS